MPSDVRRRVSAAGNHAPRIECALQGYRAVITCKLTGRHRFECNHGAGLGLHAWRQIATARTSASDLPANSLVRVPQPLHVDHSLLPSPPTCEGHHSCQLRSCPTCSTQRQPSRLRGTWKCGRAAAAAQLPVSALWHYTRHPRRPEARAARVFEAPSAKQRTVSTPERAPLSPSLHVVWAIDINKWLAER